MRDYKNPILSNNNLKQTFLASLSDIVRLITENPRCVKHSYKFNM